MNTIPATHAFSEAVMHLSGFLFVLAVLSVLWLVIEAIGTYFQRLENKKKASEQQANKCTSPEQAAMNGNEMDEELLAVIASAVTLLLDTQQHRLISIQSNGMQWSREGRRAHQYSHTYR